MGPRLSTLEVSNFKNNNVKDKKQAIFTSASGCLLSVETVWQIIIKKQIFHGS